MTMFVCDGCKNVSVDPWHYVAHIHGGDGVSAGGIGRLNSSLTWAFCSSECRAAWHDEPTDAELFPFAHPPAVAEILAQETWHRADVAKMLAHGSAMLIPHHTTITTDGELPNIDAMWPWASDHLPAEEQDKRRGLIVATARGFSGWINGIAIDLRAPPQNDWARRPETAHLLYDTDDNITLSILHQDQHDADGNKTHDVHTIMKRSDEAHYFAKLPGGIVHQQVFEHPHHMNAWWRS